MALMFGVCVCAREGEKGKERDKEGGPIEQDKELREKWGEREREEGSHHGHGP